MTPFADDPLTKEHYQEAARIARTLGEAAATAMLQAERKRHMLSRIDAAHAALQARRGLTWGQWLAARLWRACVASCAVVGVHALLSLGYPPDAVASFDLFTGMCAIVFTLVSPGA